MLHNRLQSLRRCAFIAIIAIFSIQLFFTFLKRSRSIPSAHGINSPIARPGPGLRSYFGGYRSIDPASRPDLALGLIDGEDGAVGAIAGGRLRPPGGQIGDDNVAGQGKDGPLEPEPLELTCPDDGGIGHLRLRSLNLTKQVLYYRRCVRTQWSRGLNRDEITHHDDALIKPEESVLLDLASCQSDLPLPCDPVILEVPPPQPPRPHPELIFGMASSYSRIQAAFPYFVHWLSSESARLVLIINDASSHDLAPLEALFAAARMDVVLLQPSPSILGLNEHQLHFTMLRDMLHHSDNATRWFGLLDDDTFIPSIDNLADVLSSFDHLSPWYLGVLSDSPPSVNFWGFMAFGGAGIFLSTPLIRQLDPLIETCLRQARIGTGDALLKQCIYENTPTRLTILPGLNQHDIHDDVSGLFEADPRPLLTLHHWNSWYSEPVDYMAAAVHWCGNCFLQRWTFGLDTLLSNGYSITVYRDGLEKIDLSRTEATWALADQGIYDYTHGPLRRKLSPDEKKQFKLVRSGLLSEGSFVQTYLHRNQVHADAPDEIVELIWEP